MDGRLSEVDGLRRVQLFGLDFVDDTAIEPIIDRVLERCVRPDLVDPTDTLPLVVTPNTDLLLQVVDDPDPAMRRLFARAWCVLPDGQPIVWASRLLGAPLRYRLTGSDLFAGLWPRLVAGSVPAFVLAPNDEVAEGLRASHADATVLVAPVVDAGSPVQIAELAGRCADAVAARKATVAVMSLGHPKDSLLAAAMLEQLNAAGTRLPVTLCLGGSAEMYLGIRKRAPKWVQRCSAEWLYRFAQEPRRLFHRYFVRDAGFVRLVAREYRATRGRRAPA